MVDDTPKKRSFNNLVGYVIEEGCFNSDGELVAGTVEEKVILFNTDNISLDEVNELLENGMADYDPRVAILPKIVAQNLSDKLKEE